jgi:hypothetical protein
VRLGHGNGPIYGYAAEFDDPTQLVDAARAVRLAGYKRFEAYTPYPIRELDEIVPGWNPLAPIVLFGGISGAITAWIMQSWIAIVDFPINVGGRPLYSWPSFVPITFELTVLFASLAAFFGALGLCGFPLPHHPVFNLKEFARVSNDRFFLCIEARDSRFNSRKTAELLEEFEPLELWEIEKE